jgi:hypothetical protein
VHATWHPTVTTLASKSIVVTGAGNGASVALGDLDGDAAGVTAEEIRAAGGTAIELLLDR